jgi:hypothetical protein
MTKKLSKYEKESRHLERMSKHIQEGQAYALSKKGKLLSTKINGKKDFVNWQCANGHSWSQPLSSTLSNLSWCAKCSGNTPRNLQVLIDIAKSRGGKVLSTKYVNVDATYDFECSLGHKFSNTFKHVEKRGQWCPTCNKGSKSEEICRTTFEQLFNQPFPRYRPKWLLNNRGNRMEIDGYCKDLKIGFEYQGRQHFDLVLFGNSPKQRKSDDKVKAKLCREHGINLFIITYKMEYRNFPKYIARQAKQFKIDLPNDFENIEVDISKAYIRNDRIKELQVLLKPKEIMVLSKKYLGSNQKVSLQCLVCNHKWSASGNAFFNSRRVAGCDKCNRRKAGERNKLNIQHLQQYAEKYGGKLVSRKYIESEYGYYWECKKGHTFVGIFSNMKYRKQFCPRCEGRQTRNIKKKGLQP